MRGRLVLVEVFSNTIGALSHQWAACTGQLALVTLQGESGLLALAGQLGNQQIIKGFAVEVADRCRCGNSVCSRGGRFGGVRAWQALAAGQGKQTKQ